MKNGIIVEGVADGKRFPVHGSAKVSALEEISIYTAEEEVPLNDVFKAIFEKEGAKNCLDHKSDNKEIEAYFEGILPNYDPERVYVSDMVKVLKWYNTLIEHKAYDPAAVEEKEAESNESGEDKPKKVKPKKAAKKAAALEKRKQTAAAKKSDKLKAKKEAEAEKVKLAKLTKDLAEAKKELKAMSDADDDDAEPSKAAEKRARQKATREKKDAELAAAKAKEAKEAKP